MTHEIIIACLQAAGTIGGVWLARAMALALWDDWNDYRELCGHRRIPVRYDCKSYDTEQE